MKWLRWLGGAILLLTLPTYSYLDHSTSQTVSETAVAKGSASGPSAIGVYPPRMLGEGQPESAEGQSGEEGSASLLASSSRTVRSAGGGFVPDGRTRSSLRDGGPRYSSGLSSISGTQVENGPERADALLSVPARPVQVASLDGVDELLSLEEYYNGIDRPTFGSFAGRSQNPFLDPDPSNSKSPGDDDGSDEGLGGGGNGDTATPVDDQPAQENPPSEDPVQNPEDPQPEGDPKDPNEPDQGDQADDGKAPEDPGPPEEPPPPEEPSKPEEPSTPRPEAVPYDFLVSRAPSLPSQPYSMRAKRGADGLFLTEDEEVFGLTQFQVQGALGLGSNSQVLLTDFNDDGLSDLVLGRNDGQGARLEIFFRQSGDGADFREPEGAIVLTGESIASLALFDFNDDGLLDVVTVLEGRPSLLILELREGALQATGELILTFQPGLVIDWRSEHTGRPERRLYIYDTKLERAAVMTSLQPDFLREVEVKSGLVPAPRVTRVNWHPQESTSPNHDILIFESPFRSVIVEAEAQGVLRLFANLDITFDTPVGVIGDYSGRGSRSIVLLP